MKRILCIALAVLLLLGLCGCAVFEEIIALSSEETVTKNETPKTSSQPQPPSVEETEAPAETELDENGWYNTKDEVALYIHLYGKLPGNYITKKEAEALGWPGGSLEPYAPGKSIGGSYFGNYEGLLPDAKGRKWTECDIDTAGKDSRGAKRIVFSNDHYETFELLYGGND